MDVRCENCETEYELDESKLKPGGVTVKCTSCGHMFKVRKRTPTLAPEGPVPAPDQPPPGEDGERTWLVRLEDGEIRTCRELATLQQWIVARQVTRDAEISRTGKKWKPLGEITELAEFFDIADESRPRRAPGAGGDDSTDAGWDRPTPVSAPKRHPTAHPRLVPAGDSGTSRAPKARAVPPSSAPPPLPPEASRPFKPQSPLSERGEDQAAPAETLRDGDTAKGVGAVRPPPPARGGEPSAGREPPDRRPGSEPVHLERRPSRAPQEGGAGAPARPARGSSEAEPARFAPRSSEPAPARPAPRSSEPAPARPARSSSESAPAAQAGAAPFPAGEDDDGGRPSGSLPAQKTGAWAVGGARRLQLDGGEPDGPTGGLTRGVPTDDVAFAGGGIRPIDDGSDDAPARTSMATRRSGGIGTWILVGSLAVMAGAAAVVYLFVFRAGGTAELALDGGTRVAATADAASDVASATSGDGGLPTIDPQVLRTAREALAAGTEDALAGAADALESADEHLQSAVLLARVEAARAQILSDRAELAADPSERRRLEREADERAARAREHAESARSLDRDDAGVLVATADAMRVSGRRSREVKRPLRKALAADPSNADAKLTLALVLADDSRTRQARRELTELARRAQEAEPVDVRPMFQLALLELREERYDEAREHADEVLTHRPDHAGARALADAIEERRPVVAADDPMPREEDEAAAKPQGYDGLLDRANRLAETGRCRSAIDLYQSALDVDPRGVEALTGLGYCHLDAREFASAHARFRSALQVSPRYQPALYGVGEAYQQQGLTDRAIAAYRDYIEDHPNGTRAAMARRQIERLGGDPDGAGAGGEDPGSNAGESPDPKPGAGGEGGGDAPGSAGGGGEDGDPGADDDSGADDGDGAEPFLSDE